MDKFWEMADESKLNTQYTTDAKLNSLREASHDSIKKICIQYRYFVHPYPDLLSVLLSKIPYGPLKSLLAEILSEELGSGNSSGAHIVWYDRFLKSIGVTDAELKGSLYPANDLILNSIRDMVHQKSYAFNVGLIGMGGECLCQIYLTNMHQNLVQNKWIKQRSADIDWQFWNFHIGEADVAHRILVRQAITKMPLEATEIQDLVEGYKVGKATWDEFWTNNYQDTEIETQIRA
jgi:Iron-containing redox enzyme